MSVFGGYNLGVLKLKNRFVRSATVEGMADIDGTPLPELIEIYETLARGGTGLIMTSAALPDRCWSAEPLMRLSIHSDETLQKWERFVKSLHRHGAAVAMQLGPFSQLNGNPVGPSSYKPGIVEVKANEIGEISNTYGAAAARARKAGFDGVQIHGCHGLPLGKFLSPYFNRRRDDYGGTHANRARIFIEIRKAIAEHAGTDFPVWIKMNAYDGISGGITGEDAVIYGRILKEGGYVAIEVTGGCPEGTWTSLGPNKKEDWFEGYYLEYASRIKTDCDITTIAVGGIRTVEMAESVVADGTADLVSLCRPLIREPDLVRRWVDGDAEPARCISCNGCRAMVRKGKGLFCVQEKAGRVSD